MIVKKRKIKKGPIVGLIVIILAIILSVVGFKLYKYYTSAEYKLGKVGYNEKEIAYLVKADDKVLEKALLKYDEYLIPLTKEKYFLWKNYKTYKDYINRKLQESNDIDYNQIITDVNVKRNYDYYTHTVKTDMSKDPAFLVNKYYSLPLKYEPSDIVSVGNMYAYGNQKLRKDAFEAFKEMFNAAKKEDITIILNSGYRTYGEQKSVYDEYKNTKGEEYADGIAARPDFSEHQTGLALDIITYGATGKTFDTTDAFKWLSKNADKYGFILRYPKGKEDITGYSYESWHYRFVGKNLASKIKKSGLTFDEYYAYYLDGE